MSMLPFSSYVPDASTTLKGKLKLAGDLGGTAALPLIKRTSRFIVAPYGYTGPADYICATTGSNQTEINQAIVAANALPGGGVVDLLYGEFFVSSAIKPLDNVWIRGNGMFQTKIGVAPSLGSSFSIIDNFSSHSGSNPNSKKWMISDLELDGSNMNSAFEGKGIYSIKDEDCKIFRVYCHDTTATGIGADDFIKTTITECIVENCGYLNKKTISNIVYSANTFTVTTSTAHGYSINSVIVLTGNIPRAYNGKFLVTSVIDATNFTIDTSNNGGSLQLTRNPGTPTQFGLTSDYSIGHSGIGIATGAALGEEAIVTNNFTQGNQNNNIFFETNNALAGTKQAQAFIISNNVSVDGGQCGYRNTGSYNVQTNNNYDFGSLIGAHAAAFTLTRTVTAASWLAGVITFTTSVVHSFAVNDTVIVTGMTPSAYNNTYTITTVPTTTTFTVALTSNPGVATIFGSAESIVHPVADSTYNNNIFSDNVLYGFYLEPDSSNVSANGNTIKNSAFYGAYIASGNATFNNNCLYGSGRQGILIPTGSDTYALSNLNICGNLIYNNGRNSAGTYDGIDLDSSTTTLLSHIYIANNQIFDDQSVQTQRYGVLIRSGGNNAYISVVNNDLSRNATAGILVQDTSNTIYASNNIGVDPIGKYSLGNITGSTTFNVTLANYFLGTLTGNITVVLTSGKVVGDMMIFELTQDATGSRIATWPANFKKAGGTLILSTSAGAIDIINMKWDGTNWVEVSRSLNVS